MARQDAERALAETERSVGRLAHVLVGTSIAGAIASLVVGFLWARRITRPIYELEVQVQSLTERTRIQVAPGRAGLEALGDQVTALVEKLEESDAALAEHRRRLMQSEKLSAVGELAAKLAHEVLNPLAGMKAAVQLLARQGTAGAAGGDVIETAEALNREVTRVEGLVRRLVNFSRPLAPRVEVAAVGALLDTAIDAARPVLKRYAVSVERREDENLEPVEVDPLLFTQVLVNLLVNAAEAMAPSGGSVEVTTKRAHVLGRDEISIRVADHGPGIRDEHLPQLFKPFFTTKPEGHGLGLAVSQNIVVEHGGRIVAENRPAREGSGRRLRGAAPGGPMSTQVLVADDEVLIRQSLRTTLAREGFDVTMAGSGAETWLRFTGGSARTSSCSISSWATPTVSISCAACGRRRRTRRSSSSPRTVPSRAPSPR